MKNLNILFTSAGRRVALIQSFRRALAAVNVSGNIVVTDVRKDAPANYVADRYELVARTNHPDYVEQLKAICQQQQIDLLIPLIDPELQILAWHRQEFEALGVKVLVSSPETITICADKRNTHHFFKTAGFDTPEILDPEALLAAPEVDYPLLIKPANGSCSVGVTKIKNARELAFFKDYVPEAIVQEFIVGSEYTVDILVDFQGRVCCVVPRLRVETRAGEIIKGITVKNFDLIHVSKQVIEALPDAIGCITLQCFITPDHKVKLIEINPRFGGGIPLSIQAGADFPRWILEMVLGKTPDIAIDAWVDGTVMLRYDDAVFVTRETIT